MSVGSNIRHIRELRGLTQKELGMKCGFSANTADVRIRQYEADKMVPKLDKLEEIAAALEVDISSLQVKDIMNDRDFMKVLFYLEQNMGLQINRSDQDSSYYFTFDKNNFFYNVTSMHFDDWYEEKSKVPTDTSDPFYAEKALSYEIWKLRFPLDKEAMESDMHKQVNDKYLPLAIQKYPNYSIKTLKDFILLAEKIYRSGLMISIGTIFEGEYEIIFDPQNLLDASDEQADIFAEFIAMVNYLDNNGITIEPNMIYNRHKYRLSYFFEYAPLKTVVKSVLAPLFESIKNGEFENDDLTRIEYEDTLKQFNVPIIQH